MNLGKYLVFDVESIGLHGPGFAVGWVLVDMDRGEKLGLDTGVEMGCGLAACDPDLVYQRMSPAQRLLHADDYKWVKAHVPVMEYAYADPNQVRAMFWACWRAYLGEFGATLAADCPWPVEARFLALCVDAKPVSRAWEGPYPFIDVASCRKTVGLDPLGTDERLPEELPSHNPLNDARQSARLLYEALHYGKRRCGCFVSDEPCHCENDE